MILFYSDQCDASKAFLLDGEAAHCTQALRKREGDLITFTDGKGQAFKGVIVEASKKKVEIAVQEEVTLAGKRNFQIHVAVAPTKNISRFEWFLEKATEFGIDQITPLLCARSERKIIKEERLKKIIISASKQSLKVNFPILNPMTKFKDFVAQCAEKERFIAHLEDEAKLLTKVASANSDALILIGPEGDFTLEEVSTALDNGFQSVSLGDYRLRTETAAISAVQAIHFINQI